jgi:ABC-type spermidine/putrescine transport system permease subunit II
MAVCLFICSGTATLMFGALLNRVPDPFTLMEAFHFMYIVLIALSVVCGILGFIAGLALLRRQRPGRTLALIAGFLSLSNIPLGTALGIYTLIVLLPPAEVQS